MKKIFLLIAILLSLLSTPALVSAYEAPEVIINNNATDTDMEEKTEMATTAAIVEYDLAYPGMLPDSPFYKIKVLRDRIVSFFISDPKKKIDYYLLQTDKGILASAILVDKGKTKLATETALKAENNFTLLTQELGKLSKKPEKEFFKKLETAALKHQEVLTSLSKRVSGDDKKTFETVVDFSKRNWETVKDYQEAI